MFGFAWDIGLEVLNLVFSVVRFSSMMCDWLLTLECVFQGAVRGVDTSLGGTLDALAR